MRVRGDTFTPGVNSTRRAVSRRTMQIFRHASFMECKMQPCRIYILTSAETAIPSGHWRCCAVKIYDFVRHKCRAKRIFLTLVLARAQSDHGRPALPSMQVKVYFNVQNDASNTTICNSLIFFYLWNFSSRQKDLHPVLISFFERYFSWIWINIYLQN